MKYLYVSQTSTIQDVRIQNRRQPTILLVIDQGEEKNQLIEQHLLEFLEESHFKCNLLVLKDILFKEPLVAFGVDCHPSAILFQPCL